ncbi:MAG: DUF6089 family protein [Cyclobacteriaceae bacterium]|nr:DUF6089 family protein [Cyclobacteriaceae bacterium]
MLHFMLGKLKIGFPIFLAVQFFSFSGFSQSTEIGFGIGTLSYTGDLARTINLSQMQPAIQGYHRTNINTTLSFKAAVTVGKLKGKDNSSFDVFSSNRNTSFNIFVFEASGMFEYHFLHWRSSKSNLRWSPYFVAGAGLLNVSGHQSSFEEYSKIQPVIPFGFGFKYIINPRWYVGLEGVARKTFFDYLDNVSQSATSTKNYQNGDFSNNDMYYFVGFSLNYSFYEIPCPFSYK